MLKRLLVNRTVILNLFQNPAHKTVILNSFQDLQPRFRIKSGMTAGAVFGMTTTVILVGLSLLFTSIPAQAEYTDSVSSDLNLSVSPVVSLSISNCDSTNNPNPGTITLSIEPSSTGTFSSTCQNINVAANTPGYSLSIKSSSTDLLYQNPTTITPAPVVASTDKLIDNPDVLPNDSWGFAIENQLNFDTTYTTNNADNTYAKLLTTDQTVYQTDKALGETPAPLSSFKAYYGAKLTLATIAGDYKTTITYTAIGEEVPEPVYPAEIIAIVPNIASTMQPSGNGTGSNGPQFSIAGSNFGANPTVTIGEQPCTEITVNSAGTALTCSGPTSDLSIGAKAVVVNNGVSSSDDIIVTYDSTNYPTLQSINPTTADCQGTPTTPVIYRDARDSQLYYVAKMQDNRCWMLDNLKYKPNGDTMGTQTDAAFTATQIWSGDMGEYGTGDFADPIASTYVSVYTDTDYCRDSDGISSQNITKCGFLYNWPAATASSGDGLSSGNAQYSICPANWRLPSGYNGDPALNDFAVLNGWMAGDGASYQDFAGGSKYYDNWQFNGPWRGLYSGAYIWQYSYSPGFAVQGGYGEFWSSTALDNKGASEAVFTKGSINPGSRPYGSDYGRDGSGYAVRCVLGV